MGCCYTASEIVDMYQRADTSIDRLKLLQELTLMKKNELIKVLADYGIDSSNEGKEKKRDMKKKEFIRLYRNGLSDNAISNQLRISASTIKSWRDGEGLIANKYKGKRLMYKCDNCGALFDKPAQYTEYTGEQFDVCPTCHDTSFGKVYQCKVCNQWEYGPNITKRVCYTCAEKRYNKSLGQMYVSKNPEYFLDYYALDFIEDLYTNDEAIEGLKSAFFKHYDEKKEADIAGYIADDMDSWIEFLLKEGEI